MALIAGAIVEKLNSASGPSAAEDNLSSNNMEGGDIQNSTATHMKGRAERPPRDTKARVMLFAPYSVSLDCETMPNDW